MGKIPWTRSDALNEAILAGYLKLAGLQGRLLAISSTWADLPPPRRAPTTIYKTGGRQSVGLNPHLLVRMLARGKNLRRRAGWRSRVAAGRAAGWAAAQLAPVVGR